jgi:hypothetical protein
MLDIESSGGSSMNEKYPKADVWLDLVAAMLVLFTAMLDARVSALLAVILLLAFASHRYMQSRS